MKSLFKSLQVEPLVVELDELGMLTSLKEMFVTSTYCFKIYILDEVDTCFLFVFRLIWFLYVFGLDCDGGLMVRNVP